MKILALDCTANSASCAVCEDETILAQSYVNSAKKHSETLAPMIEELFLKLPFNISDIELFACNAGPGSFTGVRIGTAQIKGLAFGRNKPCIPVSTLESLAYNMQGFSGIICPVMDARRSQLYNALFYSDGNVISRLCDDRLISSEDLKAELEKYTENDIYFVGDGYDTAMKTALLRVKKTPQILIHQNAWSTAFCALKKYKEDPGEYGDAELMPIYLRASQAERTREENLKIISEKEETK